MIGFFDKSKPSEAPFHWVNLPGEEKPLLLLNYKIYKHIDETLGMPGPAATKDWAPVMSNDRICYEYQRCQEARIGSYKMLKKNVPLDALTSYALQRNQWIIKEKAEGEVE